MKRSLNALLDQAASSASNVLALVLLARALDADTFGRFSLGYAVLVLVLSLTRAALGTRITLTPDHDQAHRVTAGVLGALTLLAVLTAAVVTGAGLLLTSGHDPALQLLVGLATPVVCAQDVLRFGAVAAGRPGVALISDLSWLALVGVALLLRTDSRTTLLVWAGGAALALVVALLGLRTRPDVRAGRDLLVRLARREDPLAASLAANSVIASLGLLAVLTVAAHLIDPAAAGSLRAAATAMGPVNVAFAYVSLSLAPTLVRRARDGDRRFCARAALVLGVGTALWGTCLLLLPDSWGRTAFGETWTGAATVLPLTVTEYVLTALGTAAVLGLKVREHAGDLLRQRVVATVLSVVAGSALAATTGDVRAVAAAVALAAGVQTGLGWHSLLTRPAPEPAPARTLRNADA
ncbi:hypothetical protein [Kineococcus sp. R86509]|uniref:hypothetical protein n=1 Tax=Kineococcus sp. R86509 TaxID=3093851 RepID=UPI0036D274D7